MPLHGQSAPYGLNDARASDMTLAKMHVVMLLLWRYVERQRRLVDMWSGCKVVQEESVLYFLECKDNMKVPLPSELREYSGG